VHHQPLDNKENRRKSAVQCAGRRFSPHMEAELTLEKPQRQIKRENLWGFILVYFSEMKCSKKRGQACSVIAFT
jgi:hypothetical protein